MRTGTNMQQAATIAARCTRSVSSPFPTKWGNRITAEFVTEDGDEVKVFADAGTAMEQVSRGMEAVLKMGAKGWEFSHLISPEKSATGPGAGRPPQDERSRKEAAAEALRQDVRMFAFIFREVSGNVELAGLAPEDRRAIATTIYIQNH